MQPTFRDSIAFRWNHSTRRLESVPSKDLSWSVSDAGTLYGAILVERFRSYGSKIVDISHHESRLLSGATHLGINVESLSIDIKTSAEALLAINPELVEQQEDVSIVLLMSPGELSADAVYGNKPTLMMHLSPLPFAKLNGWYQVGVDVVLDTHQVVPNNCWPNQIKCRSRLPYFLSDPIGNHRNKNSLAVLRTANGCLADTSVANLLLIDHRGDWISPKKEDILVGCTLQVIEQLLAKQKIPIQYRDVTVSMLHEAHEVILTGSSGGIWFARSWDGVMKQTPRNPSKTGQLTELWKQYVSFDFVAQAARRAQ